MNTSSTLPKPVLPLKWAKVSGITSDGSPAYLPPCNQRKPKENYVFSTMGKPGYYHVETKEAHQILLRQVNSNLHNLESQIAMEECCNCFTHDRSTLMKKEKELKTAKEVYSVILNRSKATRPSGSVDSNTNAASTTFYDNTGIWLYPTTLWSACGDPPCDNGFASSTCNSGNQSRGDSSGGGGGGYSGGDGGGGGGGYSGGDSGGGGYSGGDAGGC